MGIERARLSRCGYFRSCLHQEDRLPLHGRPMLMYISCENPVLSEVDDLKSLGADEVIPEEFETSIDDLLKGLAPVQFPQKCQSTIWFDKIRSNSYTALRTVELPRRHLFEKYEWLPEIEIDGYPNSRGFSSSRKRRSRSFRSGKKQVLR